jgi:hypothetical protein
LTEKKKPKWRTPETMATQDAPTDGHRRLNAILASLNEQMGPSSTHHRDTAVFESFLNIHGSIIFGDTIPHVSAATAAAAAAPTTAPVARRHVPHLPAPLAAEDRGSVAYWHRQMIVAIMQSGWNEQRDEIAYWQEQLEEALTLPEEELAKRPMPVRKEGKSTALAMMMAAMLREHSPAADVCVEPDGVQNDD